MKQYQKIWLVVAGLLCLPITEGHAQFSTVEGASGSQYSTYSGVKQSRFCRFMRPSRCGTLSGFMRYLNAGCINDTDRESKCLQRFCGQNCAGYSCPDPNSETGRACQQHCRFVNLRNAAAQSRLQACVQGAYSSSQAAAKEAGRTYDRAQLRALRGQQKGADIEARRMLSQIQKYIRSRDELFVRMRRMRSHTLENWVLVADKAKNYTRYIGQVNATLQNGDYPQDRKNKATDMVRRSNNIIMSFVKMAGALNRHAEGLMQTLRDSTSAPSSAPLSQAQMTKAKEGETYRGLPMTASAPFEPEDAPPSYTPRGRQVSIV